MNGGESRYTCDNAKLAELQVRPYRPDLELVCLDPDNCAGEFCELADEPWHHYGCECEQCIEWYRSLK